MSEINYRDVWNLFEEHIQGILLDPSVSLPHEIKEDRYIECTLPEEIQKRLHFNFDYGTITKVQCRVIRGTDERTKLFEYQASIMFFNTAGTCKSVTWFLNYDNKPLEGIIGVDVYSYPHDAAVATAFCNFINNLGGNISTTLPRATYLIIDNVGTEYIIFDRAQIHNVCVDGDESKTTRIRVCGTKFSYMGYDCHRIKSFPTIYFVGLGNKETRPSVQGTTIESLMLELAKVIHLDAGRSQVISDLEDLSKRCDGVIQKTENPGK